MSMRALTTAAPPDSELDGLIGAIRSVVDRHADWQETACLVARELERNRPSYRVLAPELRRGEPDGYRSHVLHTEPDGSFSIVALVWRPGQATPIHDHVTWCVFTVVQGVDGALYVTTDNGGGTDRILRLTPN